MYYNCHIHLFTNKDVPNNFLPLGLVKVIRSAAGFKALSGISKRLIALTDSDVIERYYRFVTTGKLGSQGAIFEKCKPYYPDDTNFIVLPIGYGIYGCRESTKAV